VKEKETISPPFLMDKGKQHTLGTLEATFASACWWILAWTCWQWPV